MNQFDEFKKWLQQQIDTNMPGTRLPKISEMSKVWGISNVTIGKILRQYQDEGWVTCIKRKGTFTRTYNRLTDLRPNIPESSAERIVYSLKQAISQGFLRREDCLPSLKRIQHRFKVSSATVVKAYNILRNQGLITKIGKSFYFGSIISDARPSKPSRVVAVFTNSPKDYEKMFVGEEIGKAFQCFEKELNLNGYCLQNELLRNFTGLCKHWAGTKGIPYGMLFRGLDAALAARIRQPLRAMLAKAKPHQVPVLFESWEKQEIVMNMVHKPFLIHRSRILKYHVFQMAELLFEMGYQHLKLCSLQPHRYWFVAGLQNGLRIVNANLSVDAVNTDGTTHPYEMFERHHEKKPGILWACDSDGTAAALLNWARTKGIKVPEELEIIGFGNDRRYLHLGITSFDPEWERMGYLLAHTVIGDFSVERSPRGFFRIRGRLIHRNTTKG